MRASRLTLIVAASAALAFLPGCSRRSRAQGSEPWVPRRACWPDAEVSTYDVLRNDTVTGRTSFRIASVRVGAQPAWEFTCVNNAIVDDMVLLRDSIDAFLSRDSLKPLSGFEVRSTAARVDTVRTSYRAGKVAVTANRGVQQTLDVSSNTFDNSILVMAIRSMDLRPGARYTVASLASFGPWTKPADVQVLGVDTVRVPAGEFVCDRVALEIAGYRLNLWYESGPARRYVRFENPAGGSSAVLTGYEAGGGTGVARQ